MSDIDDNNANEKKDEKRKRKAKEAHKTNTLSTQPASPSLVAQDERESDAEHERATKIANVRRSVPVCIQGDCIGEMKKMATGSCDLVLADPPYGINVRRVAWDKPINPNMDAFDFTYEWIDEAVRILKPGGTLLFFSSPCTLYSSYANVHLDKKPDIVHRQTLSWIYSQGGDCRLENMKQYAVRSEVIEWWTKNQIPPTFNAHCATERYTEEQKKVALAKGVGRVTEASLDKGRPPRTWCDIPRENSRSTERSYSSIKHPAMKPLDLAERLVGVHSNEGDLVVVPFAGSGTEMLSAHKLKRQVVGIEIDPNYVELMKKRFEGHSIECVFRESSAEKEELVR